MMASISCVHPNMLSLGHWKLRLSDWIECLHRFSSLHAIETVCGVFHVVEHCIHRLMGSDIEIVDMFPWRLSVSRIRKYGSATNRPTNLGHAYYRKESLPEVSDTDMCYASVRIIIAVLACMLWCNHRFPVRCGRAMMVSAAKKQCAEQPTKELELWRNNHFNFLSCPFVATDVISLTSCSLGM